MTSFRIDIGTAGHTKALISCCTMESLVNNSSILVLISDLSSSIFIGEKINFLNLFNAR